MMKEFDFILLLQKRFSSEINAEESAHLDHWINQSPANAELARQYETVWNSSSEMGKQFSLNLDAEFAQLQSRINGLEKSPARTISIGQWAFRIAAAVVLVLFSVWGYNRLIPTEVPVVIAEVSDQPVQKEILPDGSVVWLRQNAHLEYPKQFEEKARIVKMSGEAYFEIAPNPDKPFRVELPGSGYVQVLGTKFNVKTDEKKTVLVREGKVRFVPVNQQEDVELTAGKKAVFFPESAQILVSDVSTFNELAWQTGGLEFISTPLKDVITDLELFYNVTIELQNSAMEKCRYTAPLTNQPIGDVLAGLARAYHFKLLNPAPGQYILSKGSCQ